MTKLVGIIYSKESILEKNQDCVNHVSANYFYCNKCWNCLVTKKFQREANKKKLKTSSITWWSICWKTGKKRCKKFPILFLIRFNKKMAAAIFR